MARFFLSFCVGVAVLPCESVRDAEEFANLQVTSLSSAIYSKGMLRSMRELPHVAGTNSSVVQTASGTQCVLPSDARWCTGIVNGQSRQVAVYTTPDPVSQSICNSGNWETGSVAALGINEPSEGKYFLDIGTHIGWFSVVFAHAGYNVISVEPMFKNRELFQATLCQNPDLADRIQIVPVALAQKPTAQGQTCDVYSCDCNVGDGLLACDGENERRAAIVDSPQFNHILRGQVPTKTLDQAMSDLGSPAIHAIKMDVEGYECHVVEGGPQTFRASKYSRIEVRGPTSQCVIKPLMADGFVPHQTNAAGKVVDPHHQTSGDLEDLFFIRA